MKSVYPNIDAQMSMRGITHVNLAEVLGLSPIAVYRRLAGITEWKLPEVIEICKYFNDSDASRLFLRVDIKTRFRKTQEV